VKLQSSLPNSIYSGMLRTLPAGFIPPSLPTKTKKLPSGGQWLHEIKHDGFRVIARKNGVRVRLSPEKAAKRKNCVSETTRRHAKPREVRAFSDMPHMADRDATAWLAFLNTVRTEHFDQVLALRPLMAAIADAA
jgi:hypothetical protein